MSIGIGYGNEIMLGNFQPIRITNSYVELFHLDAFDCTNYFLVSETTSKAVLAIFISILGTGVANLHRDNLIDGHFRLHEPGPKSLVLRWRIRCRYRSIQLIASCANLPHIAVTRKRFPVTFVASSRNSALLAFNKFVLSRTGILRIFIEFGRYPR